VVATLAGVALVLWSLRRASSVPPGK
jgi:hypothetical protein